MKSKRAATITLELPENPLPEILGMIQDFASDSVNTSSNIISKVKSFFTGRNRNKFKDFLPLIILGVVVVGALLFIGKVAVDAFKGQTLGMSDSRIEIKGPKAKMSLDKTYYFPLVDDKGKVIAKLRFFLDDAEVRDEIILDGQKAVAPKGTTYLITTIELTNDSNKFIEMKVRNYVRLSKNSNKKLYAAGIHNDPVEIQPQSTKLTRLGFPISDTDKDFILRVGDLDGKKELVKLNLD